MLNGSCTPKSCRDIANNDTARLPSRSGSELWPKGMSSWRQGELSSMRLVEAQRVVRKGNMSGRIRKYHSIYVVLFHVYIYIYNYNIYIYIHITAGGSESWSYSMQIATSCFILVLANTVHLAVFSQCWASVKSVDATLCSSWRVVDLYLITYSQCIAR